MKLVIGCGYLGVRVARVWRSMGDEVTVTTRSESRALELSQEGFCAVLADVTRPDTLQKLPAADCVVHAVAYDRRSGQTRRAVQVEGLINACDALHESAGRFILISSTGVFSQEDGSWVDEDSPCSPKSESGRACLAAEQALTERAMGRKASILRLAGIYGPGRVPRRDELVAGKSIGAAPDSYLNLIHVEDAARVVLAAADSVTPPRLLLVADGRPVLRREYYAELARRYHAPAPRFEAVAAATDRGTTNKRVDNRRMLGQLRIKLNFPSFREGLAAIMRDEEGAT